MIDIKLVLYDHEAETLEEVTALLDPINGALSWEHDGTIMHGTLEDEELIVKLIRLPDATLYMDKRKLRE